MIRLGLALGSCLGALSRVAPRRSCPQSGLYFDATRLQCDSCSSIDSQAVLVSAEENAVLARQLERLGSNQCRCSNGLVQCFGGDRCLAADGNTSSVMSEFIASGPFECRQCPEVNGQPMAPTQDKSRCLPCLVDENDPETTSGYSTTWGDCVCPEGSALLERRSDGAYLAAKKCVRCASGLLFSSSSEPLPSYGCTPCPDTERMYRQASTGKCICRQATTNEAGFVEAGGACVSSAEFNEVNNRFPESAAVYVQYRDIIDGREAWWKAGPFGQFLGIEARTASTFEVLKLDAAGAQDVSVTSAAMKWLYMRCSVGCLRGNATACQCVSNLCVLQLYDYEATVCAFVQDLYQGKARVPGSTAVEGMPWLYYSPQRPVQTLQNPVLNWRLNFADVLVFWLASYSLEGAWLGWQRLESQLDPCSKGGTSSKPRSLPSAWRRFGSSLRSECNILASSILECGLRPVFYDLFVENTDGSLVPVPVRILNIVTQTGGRPNLNLADTEANDDVLVRRFMLCDGISGRESGPGGPGEAYLDGTGYLRVLRWAAHLAVQAPGFVESVPVPDSGISAWRSLFVCNELNERLTATRAVPEITWLAILALLDGCQWSNAARWTTHADGQSAMAAEFNPFLQFSLGISVWIFVLVLQFLLQRIGCIFLGHDLNDFMDVCSIANISVFILDEPFHGYYIHGKAPSSRGDWGHTELERVLHDEDKGIGFSRGLSPDGCQTFEMFLPPDTAVQLANGDVAHFRQQLGQVFMDVQMTQDTIARRDPPKPISQDVAQMSQHRCNVQALVDAMVNAVMRGANEVLQMRSSFSWFWGTAPNVLTLQHPIFYKDQDGISFPNGLGWSSSLAYGAELRIAGIGIPLGFEWHLGLLELMTFSLMWRFQGSIGLACALAYLVNRSVLYVYGAWGKARLAHTAIINGMFLI
ncbi:unnamed protein product [Durusdinium trenchii]|uniref:Meckelin n=1 Tax=Durusdinium trenchii TaxID=1381693 RepID=A0ABP0HYX0_9DINO